MNTRTIRTLAIVFIALLTAMIVIEMGDDSLPSGSGNLLLPDLKAKINDIDSVAFRGADETITIVNDGERWSVSERNNFPADVGKLREVLLALADARTLEQKSSNPERYAQLGLEDPGTEGTESVAVEISGGDFDYAVIVGKQAQSSNRYVRLAGQDETWLINTNPDIPGDAGGWLLSDIVDVDSKRVRSVRISHPDGESIAIFKDNQDDTNFKVADIPDGRELSYPSVANGMGGVLNDLQLDDVRQAVEMTDAVVTEFETFDGLAVTVRSQKTGEDAWIEVTAEQRPVEAPAEAGEDDTGALPEGDDETTAEADESETAEPGFESADAINARVGGWQYKIADYKSNLLVRRWEDILKAPEEDSDE